MKVLVLTNIPAPYREGVYEELSKKADIDLTVIYCALIEKNRQWVIQNSTYHSIFLNSKTVSFGENHFHFSFGQVIKQFRLINPDIVITNAFALPMLLAFLLTILHGKKHISFTDGTLITEKGLSFLHKLIRKLVYSKTKAFIGPSNATYALFKSYGINDSKIFKSHLCVDNEKYGNNTLIKDRDYDLLFIGQFIKRKCPDFFVKVVIGIIDTLGTCKVRVAGSGPLQQNFLEALKVSKANIRFDGFVQQDELPDVFGSAKLLLMPTLADCWGVVANEALASGTPVITNPEAGVANELVIDGISGKILDLDAEIWVKEIVKLLREQDSLQKMSCSSTAIVSNYTHKNASQGIYNAIQSVK